MKLSVMITPANPQSIPEVVALLSAQLQEHEIAVAEHALRDVVCAVLADSRHGFILVAEQRGRAVGIAYVAAHLSAEHGGTVGWLEELYVAPDQRGHGVGSALLEALGQRVEQLDWRALELEVVAGHERAVPLYVRHGFAALDRARFSRIFPARLP